MIAVDTSTVVAYLAGQDGDDVEALDEALRFELAVLPAVVLTELLSVPDLDSRVERFARELPLVEPSPGFWERAAASRRRILSKRRRARLADTLIAQLCLDQGVPLITRDTDFRHFAQYLGLELV